MGEANCRHPDNYVGLNSTYPEGWEIRILRIIGSGDEAASEVEVRHRDMGVFRVVSLWTVADGKIIRGTEYWTSPGSEAPGTERAAYVEHLGGVSAASPIDKPALTYGSTDAQPPFASIPARIVSHLPMI